MELDPLSAVARRQRTQYFIFRSLENAQDQVDAWLKFDPLSPYAHLYAYLVYALRQDPAKAEFHFRRTLDLDQDFWVPHWTKSIFLRMNGNHEEALASLMNAANAWKNRENNFCLEIVVTLAETYSVLGRREDLRNLLTILDTEAEDRYVSPTCYATVHAGLGDLEQAREYLMKAILDRDMRIQFLEDGGVFSSLTDDPVMQEILDKKAHGWN